MKYTMDFGFRNTQGVRASTIGEVPHPLSVLFIGEAGADAVLAELQRGGYQPTLERVTTKEQLVSALAHKWDIAISDYSVGDTGAIAALHTIQEKSLDVPLIVVSGRIKDSELLS